MPEVPALIKRAWSSALAVYKAAAEGEPRSGPWRLPITGGWLPADVGSSWNWWQKGFNPSGMSSQSAMVEACISAYSQTMAMCPGTHWWSLKNGGRERIINSALSRIVKKPNEYQSFSDFQLNAIRSLYLDGNAYALAIRNARFEIEELHLMDPNQSRPMVAETGDVFYRLGGNSIIDRQINYDERIGVDETIDTRLPLGPARLVVPKRDVLHIRLHCPERKFPYPLVGETPLMAAMGDLAWYESIRNQQEQFFTNQARPSAVLTTDLVLNATETQQLRDRWNDQAKGLHAGGVPILTSGLKVMPWTEARARDMQVAEQLKMTQDQIALVFRIPLAILGLEKAPAASTEALMGQWIAMGLGFCLNHTEEAFDKLFALKGQPDEYTEFDTSPLLRSAAKERIDMLARSVQGGIYSPNEARAREDLPAVEAGDEPRVQQQVVPLSAASAIPAGPGGGGGPPIPPMPPAPGPGSAPGPSLPATRLPPLKMISDDDRRLLELDILSRADKFDCRSAA